MDTTMGASLIVIPIMVMLAPVAITITVMLYRYRRTKARYNLLVQLAEKGVILPEQLLLEPGVAFCERRRALTLISGGIGLITMFLTLPFRFDDGSSVGQMWGLGLLPLMIGLGYLASWWLNRRGPLHV